jgi:hypothetical protein
MNWASIGLIDRLSLSFTKDELFELLPAFAIWFFHRFGSNERNCLNGWMPIDGWV